MCHGGLLIRNTTEYIWAASLVMNIPEIFLLLRMQAKSFVAEADTPYR